MGVIKVETFDVDITAASGNTHTLTNSVGSLGSAFVRRTTSIDKQSGLIGNTGNLNPDDVSGAAWLSGLSTISFVQQTANTQKIVGEVWRYEGAASGADEFIVRGRHTITLADGATTGSISVSNVINADKCIPFWTGSSHSATSVNDYDSASVAVWMDASNNIQVERGLAIGTMVVYITIVEFTGANWSVGHAKSTNHDTADETNITIRTNSLATSGTFDVGNWTNAMLIEGSLESDASGETGLADNLGTWIPGGNTSTVDFTLHQDGGARNNGDAYIHILKHPGLIVNRGEDTNFAEGNNSYTAATFPAESSTTESLDELSLEWFSDTSGTGTAHARGRLSAYINSPSSITTWVHRSGNNVRVNYGVVQLSAIDGSSFLSISDVDTDNIVSNTQTNVNINGAEFEALQGAGTISLTENIDGSGISIPQTINSWSDTQVNIDIASGALSDSNCFIRLVNDSGTIGVIGIQVGTPPVTYREIIANELIIAPDHYIPFHTDYTADLGGINATTRVGSPTFTSLELTRGSGGSLEFDSVTDGARMNDSNNINLQALSTRQIMFWVRVTGVQKSPTIIYEEGGSVNNWCFFLGAGNWLVGQMADTGDDNVHNFSNFPLAVNRTYCIILNFDYTQSGVNKLQKMYIDGIEQNISFGNPLTSSGNHLDSHSGDISFGQSESSLEVFGTDVSFPCATTLYMSDFASWRSISNANELRVDLFERGVVAEKNIAQDTEANMQIALDVFANTVASNNACDFIIQTCTDGDFQLTLNNYVFDDSTSINLQYEGTDVLTIVNANGSNLDSNKISTPNGGTVIIEETIITTIEGIPVGVEWHLYEKSLVGGVIGTVELAGVETKLDSSDVLYSDRYSSDTDVVLQIIQSGVEEILIEFTLVSEPQTVLVNLITETNI